LASSASAAYLWNSVFITVVATLLTLLINSMAAFALSKYQLPGQKTVFLLIIATLMIPPTIILVPVFLVINAVGLLNSLWGVILPAIATPTGVFLVAPVHADDSRRADRGCAHGPCQRVAHLLAHRAAAVGAGAGGVGHLLGDVALERLPAAADRAVASPRCFTLQLALNSFQGELNTQWHYLLAMTVITLLPDHAGLRLFAEATSPPASPVPA